MAPPNDTQSETGLEIRMTNDYRWLLMLVMIFSGWLLTMSLRPSGASLIVVVALGAVLTFRGRVIWALACMGVLWCSYLFEDPLNSPVYPPSYVIALLALIFLSTACRYCEASRFRAAFPLDKDQGIRPSQPPEYVLSLFSSRWFGAYAAVCTAMLLLAVTPSSDVGLWPVGLKAGWGQWILMVIGLGLLWVFFRVVFRSLRRSSASPAEIEIEARSIANSELYHDTLLTERKLAGQSWLRLFFLSR